ncbi:MAG: endonuclease domain-containing protein [Lachnospiraceae bacterium]|nr:endonuclease domain-containing protein [Lachnospiraceae bacterium]
MKNINEVKNILNFYELELIKYIKSTNIIACDKYGYKYKININNLQRGMNPSKYMKNPFAYENFNLYLSLNYPNYKLLDSEYNTCKTKMRFICEKHKNKGIQMNTVDNIINSHHVCKYCSYEQMKYNRMIKEDVAMQLCESKKVQYYGRYTKNHETYIQYYCEKHQDNGIQSMSLTHLKESKIPCRYCVTISLGELRIQNYLIEHNIKFETQKRFEKCMQKRHLRFDFYLPDYNIVIEYDGQQHFKPIRFSRKNNIEENFKLTQERDKIKNQYCMDNNIRIIRIPYWEYDNIEEILKIEL